MNLDKGPSIWIKVPLKDKYQRSCKNELLKKKGEFYVRKSPSSTGWDDWDFKAFLENDGCGKDENILSELNADKPGRCNHVETYDEGSRGCGLATSLLEICFEDENVGGIDPKTDELFQDKPMTIGSGKIVLKKWRDMAIENCEHIAMLDCYPQGDTPTEACSGYLTAALNAQHTMMFTYHEEEDKMDVMSVINAQVEFWADADEFVYDVGRRWIFCKCKQEKLRQCNEMS